MKLPGHRRCARGFTLLEVIVSLGILAVALLAIGDLNGGAVRMHAYSKSLTVAVQLARGEMLDVEYQLHKDGLSDFSKEYHGDFSDEGWPHYTWKADVIKPDFDVDPERIVQLIGSGMGLPSGQPDPNSGGAPPPLPGGMQNPLTAGGPLSGIIDMQVKAMSETIKQSVREVKLTVFWKVGAEKESFDVVQDLVILPTSTQGTTAAGAAPGTGIPQLQQLNQMGGLQNIQRMLPQFGAMKGFP